MGGQLSVLYWKIADALNPDSVLTINGTKYGYYSPGGIQVNPQTPITWVAKQHGTTGLQVDRRGFKICFDSEKYKTSQSDTWTATGGCKAEGACVRSPGY